MKKFKKIFLSLIVLVVCGVTVIPNNSLFATNKKDENNDVSQFVAKSSKAQSRAVGFAVYDGIDLSGATDRVTKTINQAAYTTTNLTVQASFGVGMNVTNRKIEIKTENGLMLETMPGMNASKVFDATLLPQNLQGIIIGATYTANPILFPTSTYGGIASTAGTLVYDIATGVASVNLEIGTKYDSKFLINDGNFVMSNLLNVKSFESTNGVESTIDNQTLEEYSLSEIMPIQVFNQAGDDILAAPGQNKSQRLLIYGMNNAAGDYYGHILNQYTLTLGFSKQIGVTGATRTAGLQSDMSVNVDRLSSTTEDFLTITFDNMASLGDLTIQYTIPLNATLGTYSARLVSDSATLFNGQTIHLRGFVMEAVNIVNASNNLLTISDMSGNSVSPTSVKTPDTTQVLGGISLRNNNPSDLSAKQIRLTFNDVNIGVRAANIIFGSPGNALNVVVKTNLGKTYNLGNMSPTTGIADNFGATIVNLSDIAGTFRDEYISEITYGTGIIKAGANSKQWSDFPAEFAKFALYYYGDFLATPSSNTISAKIDVIEATENFATATPQTTHQAMMNVTEEKEFWFFNSTSIDVGSGATSYIAGTTHQMSLTLGGPNFYRYSNNAVNVIEGFELYLREDKYFRIDRATIKIVDDKNVTLTEGNGLSIFETLDNTGNRVLRVVAANAKLGNYNDKLLPNHATVTYNLKIRTSAPTTSVSFADMYFIKPIKNMDIIKANFATNETNKFNVDGSNDVRKLLGSGSASGSFIIQSQKEFIVTTAGNLNNGSWSSYDYATNQRVLTLNPVGHAKYQLGVANNSGSTINGYTALIPVPKAGEQTPLTPASPATFDPKVHLQKEAFSWTEGVNSEIIPNGRLNYTVLYATTYEIDKDATTWLTWAQITDKTTIRMIKIETTDAILDGETDAIDFPIDINDPNADQNSGKTNIYSSRIFRSVLGTEAYLPSEPLALKLRTGTLKGQVYLDVNKDGVYTTADVLVPGVGVTAYLPGTTTVLETTTTKLDGTYELIDLDRIQPVDLVFTNPSVTDASRFSNPVESIDHLSAMYLSVTPTGTNYDKMDASLINPYIIRLDGGVGSLPVNSINAYPGDPISSPIAIPPAGSAFEGWYTAATGGTKITFPYTATQNTTLYAQYTDASISGKVFEDTNYDGLFNDSLIKTGVTIQLIDATTKSVIATTSTDATGSYSFNLILALQFPTYSGSYAIKIVLPASYIATSQGVTSIVDATTLESNAMTSVTTVTTDMNIGIASDISVTVNPVSQTLYLSDLGHSDITITNGSVNTLTWATGGIITATQTATGVNLAPAIAGSDTLNVTFLNGYGRVSTLTKQITLTVLADPTLVTIPKIDLALNGVQKINPTFTPATATITYSSSTPAKVTVDAAGNVTGVSKGSSIIDVTLTTADNLKTITRQVVVTVDGNANLTTKEAISGHDFKLTPAEVRAVQTSRAFGAGSLLLISRAQVTAWSIDPATLNAPVAIDSITQNIADTPGSYPVTFITLAGTSITVYAHVGDNVVVDPTNQEAINAIDFIVTLANVPTLDNAKIIANAKAQAWSTAVATLNNPVAITSVTHNIQAVVGSYPVTFTTLAKTSVTIYAHVGDNVIINPTNQEAMNALDFKLTLSDVSTLNDTKIIANAKAQAWSTAVATLNNPVAITSVTHNIKAIVGSYPVTFKTALGTSITVYAHVGDNVVVDPINQEAINAMDFKVSISDVAKLDNAKIIANAKAQAWSTAVATLNNPVAITSVTHSIQATLGVYQVTFKTALGTSVTISANVVNDDVSLVNTGFESNILEYSSAIMVLCFITLIVLKRRKS